MTQEFYNRFRHLILYGIIGGFSAGFDFLIYTVLVERVEIPYLIANCFSVFCGITISFIFNRNFNFKVKDKTKRRFVIFFSVGLFGLLLSNIILYTCIDVLSWNKIVSKLLSIALVVFFQFLLNKYVTFKPSIKHG